jgi:Ca2+-binding RTX toxin-like protein
VSIILNKNEYLHKLEKLVAKSFVLGIAMAMVTLTVVGTILPSSSVWAATIQCKSSIDTCLGTDEDDTMIGDDGHNLINPREGNDVVSAKGGPDNVQGDTGNDKLYGDQGNDFILGQEGADLLSGGDGNDEIYHFSANAQKATDPDGSKDRIDCGAGNDEAWINVSVDHDIAANCETLHTG